MFWALSALFLTLCVPMWNSAHKLFSMRGSTCAAQHAQPHSNSAKQRIESSCTVSRTRVKALQEAARTRHDLSGCCWVVQHTFLGNPPLPSPALPSVYFVSPVVCRVFIIKHCLQTQIWVASLLFWFCVDVYGKWWLPVFWLLSLLF